MNDKILKIIFIILFELLTLNSATAKTISTASLDSNTMKKIERWVEKGTTVFIELDDTVMIPESKMFSFIANPNRQFIDNIVIASRKMPAYKQAAAAWYGQRRVKLVDDKWIDFIGRLKAKGAIIYGICKMPLRLTNIEEKRYQEVKQLGINFLSTVNNQESLVIAKKNDWFSAFHKGIIFIGPYSQAQALLDFIRVTNHIPPKMLVIGSSESAIKKIDQALKIFNMYYYSVYYTGARTALAKPDSAVVKLQQRELIQNNRWLEDDAAAALLTQNNDKK